MSPTEHCHCGGDICGTRDVRSLMTGAAVVVPLGRAYQCEACRRHVPWCCGAGDDSPELCDDCWAAKHGLEPTP